MEALDILEKQTLELCEKTILDHKSPQFAYQLYFIALKGLGVLNWQNASVSGENHLIENILPKLIQEAAPVFLDVGAYHGSDFPMPLYIPSNRIRRISKFSNELISPTLFVTILGWEIQTAILLFMIGQIWMAPHMLLYTVR
jgi:hypothetical protein